MKPSEAGSAPAVDPRWLHSAGIFAAVLPAVLLVAVLAHAAVNIPVSDDYFSLLPFLSSWRQHTSSAEAWHLLTEQFYSHRLILSRIVALLDLRIFGQFNFIALQAAGWAGWLAVAFGLPVASPAVRRSPWLALPVTLLLLHLEGYTNFLFALDMVNLWVVAFALLAAVCAFQPRPASLALALVFAGLASISFVNGLLAFPAVFAALMLRRRFVRAAWFGATGAGVWLVYFHGYQEPLAPLSLAELCRKAAIMAGGFVTIGRVPDTAALGAGAVALLLAAALLCWPRAWRALPAHAAFLLFVVGSILIAARGRMGWDDYYMLQDRYRLYGLLVLALAYLFAVELLPRPQWLGTGAAAGAAAYCLFSYASFSAPMRANQRWCIAAAMNAQIGERLPACLPAYWDDASANLKTAAALGIYRFPAVLSPGDLNAVRALATAEPAAAACYLEPNGAGCGFSVRFPASSGQASEPPPAFGALVVEGRTVILPVDVFRVRFGDLWRRFSVFSDQFGLILPQSEYTVPGRHAAYGLSRDADGKLKVVLSGTLAYP